MTYLVEWLRSPNVALDEKILIYQSLKSPGVCVPNHDVLSIAKKTKTLLQSPASRKEGLLLLDLILDRIGTSDLVIHIFVYMQLLLEASADCKIAESCFGLLHRLVLRLKSMLYVHREIKDEIFPRLMQVITRELAKPTVSPSLLSLTRVTVKHFGKMCAPNRVIMETFLLKHLVRAERLNPVQSESVALTLALLAYTVSDPNTRHRLQTSYVDMMLQSCEVTERLFSTGVDPNTSNPTIYSMTGLPALLAEDAEPAESKFVIWKRLQTQLQALKVLISSPAEKTIPVDAIFKFLHTIIIPVRNDEHLSIFLAPVLQSSVEIVQSLIRLGGAMRIKSNQFTEFFEKMFELTLPKDVVDISFLRCNIYNAMAEWLQSFPPTSFYLTKRDTLSRILNTTCSDLLDENATPSMVSAALYLQKAIVSAYGEKHEEHIRQILRRLIPSTLELSRPFREIFMSNTECRLKYYELLLVFVTRPNTTLMPPTPQIEERILEGLNDHVYEVRELCQIISRMTLGIIEPLECGFGKSASHALHEHHRTVERLQLTRIERTRSAETQTMESTHESSTRDTNKRKLMNQRSESDEDEEMIHNYSKKRPRSTSTFCLKPTKNRKPNTDRPSLPIEVYDDLEEEEEDEEDEEDPEEEEDNEEEFLEPSSQGEGFTDCHVVIADDEEDVQEMRDTSEEDNLPKSESGERISSGLGAPQSEPSNVFAFWSGEEQKNRDEAEAVVAREASSPCKQIEEAAITKETIIPEEIQDVLQMNGSSKANGDGGALPGKNGAIVEETENISACVVALDEDDEEIQDDANR